MRQRLPFFFSAVALVIAILGSTSIGEAANNAVRQGVQKAKAGAGLAAPTVRPRRGPRGLRGLRGLRGPVGPRGPAGADGTALAYAHINQDGTVDAARSKTITQANVSHPSTGLYCFSLSTTSANAVASVGEIGSALAAVTSVSTIPGGCAGGTNLAVETYTGTGQLADNDFMINVN